MNALVKNFQKVVLSLLVAILTTSFVTMVGIAAGPFSRSEGASTSENLWKVIGPQAKKTLASANCLNSYCGYLTQPVGTAKKTIYGWKMGPVNNKNKYDWCAFIPSMATAAVQYNVVERSNLWSWSQLVNQANHQGQYVYIGYSDYPNEGDTTKYPELDNACQSGYSCDGRRVYFDTIRYTTYPTRNTSCQ